MNSALTKPDSTQLALSRTWLAHERTLMAWVRTAASMISFGFTIYKFFEFDNVRGTKTAPGLLTPRAFAVILVCIGLVSLLVATLENRKQTRQIAPHLQERPRSLAEVVAGIMSVFGILVLVSAICRT
jgi:inner membrane protein YidH